MIWAEGSGGRRPKASPPVALPSPWQFTLRRPLSSCRLVACFVLLAVGRVVNIALPITYKKVVDRLADTSAAAAANAAAAVAAEGGGAAAGVHALCAALAKAAAPTFRDVFLPWIAAYLALAFLQVGNGGG